MASALQQALVQLPGGTALPLADLHVNIRLPQELHTSKHSQSGLQLNGVRLDDASPPLLARVREGSQGLAAEADS